MRLIDRTAETAATVQTRNGRNIYSHGNASARRDVGSIHSIILHQTAFVSSSVARFDFVIANYVVMQNGDVLFVRPLSAALNSIGTNQHAIDIEFVGNYPSAGPRGVGAGPAPGAIQLTAGRELVSYLRANHAIHSIFGHIQFTVKNCPGPHIWYNVGEWAIRNGMTRSGRGRPIPTEWQSPSLAVAGLAP
jgi:hypothetical protein